ncbi:MAG TPA: heme-copper oxidase subunit III [Thermomicrobiales bacterium]|nr:heme-copper oxidase subunit III [Thermomicrobiales bacterium]
MATTAVDLQTARGSGAAGHDAPGHTGGHYTSMGIDSRKIGMWIFLASDCMFFGSLIATYMIYRGRADELFRNGQGNGPLPHEILDIPYTSVSAFVLLMSSLTMVLALAAVQKGDPRGTRIWLLCTALLGSIFLGGQYFEFTSFHHEGLSLTTNMFGSTFFTLTGFHGFHVTLGVIMLLSLVFLSMRGGVTQRDAINVEIIGLYWHFVDIVWIVIFTLVYLLPYEKINTIQESGHQAMRFLGLM